jgi:hypothetical protein
VGRDTLTFGRVIALYFSRFCPAKLVGFVNMTQTSVVKKKFL